MGVLFKPIFLRLRKIYVQISPYFLHLRQKMTLASPFFVSSEKTNCKICQGCFTEIILH